MSSNVGLTTPRGSGTSGYVQRNSALLKPRNTGYGAPYPPISGANGSGPMDRPFKQRVPDKQILEHDRKRAIEVKVMEERERLEEENERIEEETDKKKGKSGVKKEGGEDGETDEGEKVLTEEEIDERCDTLRQRLLKELEEDLKRGESGFKKPFAGAGNGRDRRNLKSYQVHELAEAKIEETERLRRAFGLREDRETGEISSSRDYREKRRD
ncbi:Pre-mRNA-splicing factor cwc21 [Penicillium concentricum]|uniref:Pre-mRNA-splicing factor cwc21 n=1 Tax=Penicillium concentricum TaxID=293559 RepID=A0A9W9SE21_9EURO|nr:Pre-mRNA-splicing factor cwc21 [Penicillium concentricum]KAJ5375514.1 Pre-mRNA-splicing factor cwc21 [Penicillium concentricum]